MYVHIQCTKNINTQYIVHCTLYIVHQQNTSYMIYRTLYWVVSNCSVSLGLVLYFIFLYHIVLYCIVLCIVYCERLVQGVPPESHTTSNKWRQIKVEGTFFSRAGCKIWNISAKIGTPIQSYYTHQQFILCMLVGTKWVCQPYAKLLSLNRDLLVTFSYIFVVSTLSPPVAYSKYDCHDRSPFVNFLPPFECFVVQMKRSTKGLQIK